MQKGLCGVVILYHPGDEVFRNIQTYADTLEKLWIFDNTEYDLKAYVNCFAGYENIEIIQDGNNAGIGYRINLAIKKALEAGYSWLLTMDQDSSFTKSNIGGYEGVVSGIDTKQNIALVGVDHHHEERGPRETFSLKKAVNIITSGAFINLRVVNEIGFMNEDLFIDEVDSDFCYRALIGGWQVLTCEGIYLKHNLGERRIVRSFKTGKKSNRGIHPPLRLYYITRNFLWVKKKYQTHFPGIFKIRTKQLFTVYKNNLLYNSERFRALRMIWKGFVDYKRNKSGRLIE